MADFFRNLHPVIQAFIATCFTWAVTALGAAMVFMTKEINRRMFDGMLGFAGGIMISASFWSMLLPAIEISQSQSIPIFFPVTVGFVLGVLTLWSIDKILPHLHICFPVQKAEGIKTNWQSSILLVLAITLHNFPEGLAVGIAFGAVASGLPTTHLTAAIALAIGIGIQDFPEGFAVSLPLRREGLSRFKSFWYGQLSGVAEPIAAVIGATAVIFAQSILPYALAFSAGAMIFVVVEEVIPESQCGGNTDIATMGAMIGFLVMMVLDLVFR